MFKSIKTKIFEHQKQEKKMYEKKYTSDIKIDVVHHRPSAGSSIFLSLGSCH